MDPMSIPSDPFGIASSFFKIQQAWLYNGAELLNITSRLGASMQAAGAEQLTSAMSENRSPKTRSDNPETALLDAIKNYSKFANKLHSACAMWLREGSAALGILDQSDNQRDLSGQLLLDESIRRSKVCAHQG